MKEDVDIVLEETDTNKIYINYEIGYFKATTNILNQLFMQKTEKMEIFLKSFKVEIQFVS